MEVSSHALDQRRVEPLRFEAGVFTNLTGDHLDYHGTMEAYAAAKARLFESLPAEAAAVVNADDEAADRMLQGCGARVLRYAFEDDAADCRAAVTYATARGTGCAFTGPWGELEASLPVIGRHNVANMAAALTALHGLGVDVTGLGEAVAACPPVPGRLEPVRPESRDAPFDVLVDYAHTDDALANVLQALRPVTRNRLRVLFGCGGDRDPSKRPRMAAAACEWADELVITSDNPRTEDPEAIIDHIVAGVPAEQRDRVRIEPDRAEAIRRAVAEAEADDVVLIAGKGHEDYQIVGTERIDFDDRVEARRALEAVFGAGPSGNSGNGNDSGSGSGNGSSEIRVSGSVRPGRRTPTAGG
jgi:UDP-N-acetylmuramoyl-L-alanyl-D-glutamate--2,6-diaminopimelate ligase